MRIAVAGGTGRIGRHVVEHLLARGHEVRVLSRRSEHHPVDLRTGGGLKAALAGAEVVVDAVNGPPGRAGAQVLVDGTRRLLQAAADAGVTHHVCVSVVGAERVPIGYYRTKLAQETKVAAGPVPWTIVRATQVHPFLADLFAASARRRVLPGFRFPLQPIAVDEVALVLADVVEGRPRRGALEVAGPESTQVRVLAEEWRDAKGVRALVVPMAVPGKAGRALAGGGLLCAAPHVLGTTTFAEWLRDDGGGRSIGVILDQPVERPSEI